MTTYIDAMEARKSFGSLLDKAFYQNQYTVVKSAGKPMAAVVPFEFLQAVKQYNEELTQRIKASAKRNNLSYSEALDLAQEAVEHARKG